MAIHPEWGRLPIAGRKFEFQRKSAVPNWGDAASVNPAINKPRDTEREFQCIRQHSSNRSSLRQQPAEQRFRSIFDHRPNIELRTEQQSIPITSYGSSYSYSRG